MRKIQECLFGHEHLAAHFDDSGIRCDVQRDGADGSYILGDVVADVAVAARGCADQHALLVTKAEGHAVDLGLDHVRNLADAQSALEKAVEVAQVFWGMGLVEAHHRRVMAHRRKRRQRGAAHALGGGVRAAKIGVVAFERLQFAVQAVVVRIADLGARLDIVQAVVAGDFATKEGDAFGYGKL